MFRPGRPYRHVRYCCISQRTHLGALNNTLTFVDFKAAVDSGLRIMNSPIPQTKCIVNIVGTREKYPTKEHNSADTLATMSRHHLHKQLRD